MDYLSSEPDFYKFLTEIEQVSNSTRTNYISYLRFLNKFYVINNTLTESSISVIISNEKVEKENRAVYTKDKYIGNFKSALNKYLKFLKSNFKNKVELEIEEEIKNIQNDGKIPITEKQNLTLSRVGQGKFRNDLIQYWEKCALSEFNKVNLLIASHIKPWRESNHIERLDMYNGLLLLPNYDKLFDKGYISFNEKGKIKISKYLTPKDTQTLNINSNLHLIRLEDKHKDYLNYHNQNCFIK